MRKETLRQATVYLFVGGVVYGVDLSFFTFIVLTWPEQYLVGNAFGRLAGAAVGFLLHKHVTFAGTHRDSVIRQVIVYTGLLIGNIMVGTALIYFLIDMSGFSKVPARIAVDAFIISMTFFISRNRVFRHTAAPDAIEQKSFERNLTR